MTQELRIMNRYIKGVRMEQLKKCPFCGQEVNMRYSSGKHAFLFWHKGLRNCAFYDFEISDQTAKSLSEAAELWNRRTNEGGKYE